MDALEIGYPAVPVLARGTIIATLAYAIFLASTPILSYELTWEGSDYKRQDSQGIRGVISFSEQHTVGVFFDEKSEKNPFRGRMEYNVASHFSGAPEGTFQYATDRTLKYFLDVYKGVKIPIITAAFWGMDGNLSAAFPWSEVERNGARILHNELLSTDEAIDAWGEDCELPDAQIDLLRSLLYRKLSFPNQPIRLDRNEQEILVSEGDQGLDNSIHLLSSIGILLPNAAYAEEI